jgi:CheY-like chemotaxis protein
MRLALLVDDHDAFRRSAAAMLQTQGVGSVMTAASGEQALALLESGPERPDVVLLDFRLPGLDGVEVADRIAHLSDPPPVILISSYAEAAADPRVRDARVRGFLDKQDLTCAAIVDLLA